MICSNNKNIYKYTKGARSAFLTKGINPYTIHYMRLVNTFKILSNSFPMCLRKGMKMLGNIHKSCIIYSVMAYTFH